MIKLKKIRLEKGISIARLSQISGVSSSYLSELENEKYDPSIRVLCAICKALEVTPNEIIKEEYYKKQ